MCGIAGDVGSSRLLEADRPAPVDDELRILRHRGPDDSGFYEDRQHRVRFFHRRLSIIDLSTAGHQPMLDRDRGTVVVFNGEIYNYRELDDDLKSLGYLYRSHSDTETLLHAYAEWGEECVQHFNGMFAFALWDSAKRKLFCARDRFGEKPLYYHQRADGSLVFASEIKALFTLGDVPRRANHHTLRRFLATGLTDTDSETFFEGIYALPAGHVLTWRAGEVTTRRYWGLPRCETPVQRSAEEWSDALMNGLRSSIRLRLRSDVPLGTCLSGGLDSSTIVTLMRDLHPGPITCFSVLYDDPGLSERRFVEALVHETGIETVVATPDGSDLHDTLQRIVWHNDQPSASRGQYSQWHAMKLAAERGTVVLLNGQGGDEVLAGYDRYVPTAMRSLALAGRPFQAMRMARSFAAARGTTTGMFVKQALYPMLPATLRTAWGRARFQPWLMAGIALRDGRAPESEGPFSDLRSHLVADLCRLSVPSLVHDEDRCSMAFSREIRLPFLDHTLVELLADAPMGMKLAGGQTKALLRRAMKGHLAEPVRTRRDKMGYPTPVARWLRTTGAKDAEAVFLSSEFRGRGFVEPSVAQGLLRAHVAAEADHSAPLWQCLSIEYWARVFLDQAPQLR